MFDIFKRNWSKDNFERNALQSTTWKCSHLNRAMENLCSDLLHQIRINLSVHIELVYGGYKQHAHAHSLLGYNMKLWDTWPNFRIDGYLGLNHKIKKIKFLDFVVVRDYLEILLFFFFWNKYGKIVLIYRQIQIVQGQCKFGEIDKLDIRCL